MTALRSTVNRMGGPTQILADAAAMSLRVRGTELRSQAVSHVLRRVIDAGRRSLLHLRCQFDADCRKVTCTGC